MAEQTWQKTSLRRMAWWRWSIASLIGVSIGSVLQNIVGRVFPILQGYEDYWLIQPAVYSAGHIPLIIPIALAQWYILRSCVYSAYWWMVATIIGVPFIFFVSLQLLATFGYDGGAYFLVTVGVGLVHGIAQWLVIRYWASHAWIWIPTSLVALLITGIITAPLFNPLNLSMNSSIVIENVDLLRLLHGIAAWTVYYIIMGRVLVAILLRQRA